MGEDVIVNNKVKDAMTILSEALEDESYYIGWKSNIAMAFVDEFGRWLDEHESYTYAGQHVHTIANIAADNFLGMLRK